MKRLKWLNNLRFIISILLVAFAFYYKPLSYLYQTLLIALAIVIFPYPNKKPIHFYVKLVLALVILGFGYYREQSSDLKTDGIMSVYYLDVGQAESTLIIFPDGKTGIIDAGTYENGPQIITKMKELGFQDIDYLFVTHAHADHIGGMGDVVKAFDIKELYMPNAPKDLEMDTFSYNHFIQEANNKKYTIIDAKEGITINNGSYNIEVVYPNDFVESQDLNQYSLIVRVEYNDVSFLFTGDAGFYAEYNILKNDIESDFLQIGHHGSYESTSQQFLEAVNPNVAIISVGKDNEHNLPNNNVLNRLEERGIHIYRTDLNGTILVKTNGLEYEIITER